MPFSFNTGSGGQKVDSLEGAAAAGVASRSRRASEQSENVRAGFAGGVSTFQKQQELAAAKEYRTAQMEALTQYRDSTINLRQQSVGLRGEQIENTDENQKSRIAEMHSVNQARIARWGSETGQEAARFGEQVRQNGIKNAEEQLHWNMTNDRLTKDQQFRQQYDLGNQKIREEERTDSTNKTILADASKNPMVAKIMVANASMSPPEPISKRAIDSTGMTVEQFAQAHAGAAGNKELLDGMTLEQIEQSHQALSAQTQGLWAKYAAAISDHDVPDPDHPGQMMTQPKNIDLANKLLTSIQGNVKLAQGMQKQAQAAVQAQAAAAPAIQQPQPGKVGTPQGPPAPGEKAAPANPQTGPEGATLTPGSVGSADISIAGDQVVKTPAFKTPAEAVQWLKQNVKPGQSVQTPDGKVTKYTPEMHAAADQVAQQPAAASPAQPQPQQPAAAAPQPQQGQNAPAVSAQGAPAPQQQSGQPGAAIPSIAGKAVTPPGAEAPQSAAPPQAQQPMQPPPPLPSDYMGHALQQYQEGAQSDEQDKKDWNATAGLLTGQP